MMIEDNYDVNIAIDGKHWARVELGWQFEDVAIAKAEMLHERFPEAEITLRKAVCRGYEVKF